MNTLCNIHKYNINILFFQQVKRIINLKKKLSLNGNSWQLYLTKDIARLIGISESNYSVILRVNKNILSVEKLNINDIKNYENELTKKLIKRGSSYSLNLSVSILELLQINPEIDFVDMEIADKKLIIKKSA